MFDPHLHDMKLQNIYQGSINWYRNANMKVNAQNVIKNWVSCWIRNAKKIIEAALKAHARSSFTHNRRIQFSTLHERACDDWQIVGVWFSCLPCVMPCKTNLNKEWISYGAAYTIHLPNCPIRVLGCHKILALVRQYSES